MPRASYLRVPSTDPLDDEDDASPQHLTLSIPSPKRIFSPISPFTEDDTASPLERGHLIPVSSKSIIPISAKKGDSEAETSPQISAPAIALQTMIATEEAKEKERFMASGILSPTPAQAFSGSYDELGRPIVDVIDSLNEDPFTLESFEAMIKSHANRGRDFIVARVTTVDPNDENRFYYSYYAAHHINKPLNNMIIVGDVHYYAIKAIAVNLTRVCESISTLLSAITNTIKYAGENLLAAASRVRSPTMSPTLLFEAPDEERCLESPSTSPLFAYFSDIPAGEEANTSAAMARLAYKMKRLAYVLSLGQTGEPGFAVAKEKRLHLLMKPEALLEERDEINGFGRPKKLPNHPEASLRVLRLRVKMVTPSAYSAYRNVKSISFLNEATSKTLLSLEDWMRDHDFTVSPTSPFRIVSPTAALPQNDIDSSRLEHPLVDLSEVGPVSKGQSSKDATNLAAAKAHIQHLQRKDKKLGGGVKSSTHTSNPSTIKNVGSPLPKSPVPRLYYTAEFIGTDDDFLMKATTRTYFKENALDPDDAVLFTIPGSVNETVDGEQHPALLNFCEGEDGESFDCVLLWVGIISFLLIFFLCLVLVLCL
ncbi:hypothetical protein BC829DRAFT_386675 [Chytridium lagenaria]|nr:hypothetical protein BC829DRAFT_386675 [Chytridium lagenaria]